MTLSKLTVSNAGGYGIGVQNGKQLSTNLQIINSTIIDSGFDGIDIKGQRLDTPDPLVIIDNLTMYHRKAGNRGAALDLRGHVWVRNSRIFLGSGNQGVEFMAGDSVGTIRASNGWGGYGAITNTEIHGVGSSPAGTALGIQGGRVTAIDIKTSNVRNAVTVGFTHNPNDTVYLKRISRDGVALTSKSQISISSRPEQVTLKNIPN